MVLLEFESCDESRRLQKHRKKHRHLIVRRVEGQRKKGLTKSSRRTLDEVENMEAGVAVGHSCGVRSGIRAQKTRTFRI